MIRVMLADDHQLVREGIKQLLGAATDIQVAAEAGNGDDALAQVKAAEFDVVVLVMSMPGLSGIDLVKRVKLEKPKQKILVLSMHGEQQYAARALKAGASGYLTKDSASAQLVGAIRKIAAGGVHITEAVAAHLVATPAAQDAAPHTLLSDREFEVFRQLVDGKGITEIADRLNLSGKTVSTHKNRILQKMNLHGTSELVRYALEHGLADTKG